PRGGPDGLIVREFTGDLRAMKQAQTRKSSRAGFTLIEILVVIVIIGILMGLLLAAVSKAVSGANQRRNYSEIQQLAVSLENFKSKYGSYPPSRLMLAETPGPYEAPPPALALLATDSLQFLNQMFPNMNLAGGIDWNGNGVIDAGFVVLEGDQVLVFCLGGIPGPVAAPGVQGFSTNAKNPAAPTAQRIPPMFEFQESRLNATIHNSPFYCYIDTYGSNARGVPY